MAGSVVDERLPTMVGFATGQRLVEGGVRKFRHADIGLLGDRLALAGELYRLHRRAIRLLRQLRIDPGVILLAERESLSRRRLVAGFAARQCLLQGLAGKLRKVV